MKIKKLAFISLLILYQNLRGQAIVIMDSLANFPLQGVTLQIGKKKFFSDDQGIIKIDRSFTKAKGILSLDGYHPKIIKMDETHSGDTIYLLTKANILEPVIIGTKRKITRQKNRKKRNWKYIVPLSKYDLVFFFQILDTTLYGKTLESIRIYLPKKIYSKRIHGNKKIKSAQTFLSMDFYQVDDLGNVTYLVSDSLNVTFGKDNFIQFKPMNKVSNKPFLLVIKNNTHRRDSYFFGTTGKRSNKLKAKFLAIEKSNFSALKKVIKNFQSKKSNNHYGLNIPQIELFFY